MALTLKHFYHQSRTKYKLRLLTPSVSLHQKITWIHLLEDRQPESIPAAPPV